MDNASFVAFLAPDLRKQILLTAGEGFLNSLPRDIQVVSQFIQERASSSIQIRQEEAVDAIDVAPKFVGGVGSGACSRS